EHLVRPIRHWRTRHLQKVLRVLRQLLNSPSPRRLAPLSIVRLVHDHRIPVTLILIPQPVLRVLLCPKIRRRTITSVQHRIRSRSERLSISRPTSQLIRPSPTSQHSSRSDNQNPLVRSAKSLDHHTRLTPTRRVPPQPTLLRPNPVNRLPLMIQQTRNRHYSP